MGGGDGHFMAVEKTKLSPPHLHEMAIPQLHVYNKDFFLLAYLGTMRQFVYKFIWGSFIYNTNLFWSLREVKSDRHLFTALYKTFFHN